MGQDFASNTVKCLPLDEYLRKHGVHKVDLIKIDVEGAELHVLKGMEQTIKANPNLRILIELDNNTTAGFGYFVSDIADWLMERDWEIMDLTHNGRVQKVLGRGDIIQGRRGGRMVLVSRSTDEKCHEHLLRSKSIRRQPN